MALHPFTVSMIERAEQLRKARLKPRGAKGAIPNFSIHLVKGTGRGRPNRENWTGRVVTSE